MDDDPKQPDDESRQSLESLDAPDTIVENGNTETTADSNELASPSSNDNDLSVQHNQKEDNNSKPPKKHRSLLHGSNLYLAGFIVIVIIAIGLAVYAFTSSKSSNNQSNNFPNQTLSPQALKQLASSNVTVGGPKQVLTVQSNAVFDGQVLVKSGLSVAGNLEIGGNLALPNIVVSGTSQFGSVQINKNLSVAGAETVQGQLTVQNNLSVNGSANFSGPINAPQVTANSLQLNGDLTLTHHISAGGGTPGQITGGAVGGGGSVSVGGSDTAGTINISTGNSPPAGCFVTVNFTTPFHATPHVVITPIGSAAAGLEYYVNRNTNNFSVCSASAPSAHQSFSFDYIIFD